MHKPISIVAFSSISSLGSDSAQIWSQYLNNNHAISTSSFNQLICCLPESERDQISELRNSNKKYRHLDDTVLYAIYSARKAYQQSGWTTEDVFGINIGSSRGATTLFEQYHRDFLKDKAQGRSRLSPLSSPTTTLGNISSWLAHDLQSKGPDISHSITCSSALHSMLNGVAWLQAGMADKFIVGGSEAPLTEFTVSQMRALGVYANSEHQNNDNSDYPCRALDLTKQQNMMVLGEAAAIACLEIGNTKNAIAQIEGVGYATELIEHNTSISTDAQCLQLSMEMALKNHQTKDIDIIVTHTPGTIKGDKAEIEAIKQVFGKSIPALTTNKWKLGHSLATSGLLSVELALMMIEKQKFIAVPYIKQLDSPPSSINNVLVNAVGFGGNAVSILISKSKT
jgi:3-oxoacyl-[acyl-carrier-protein] synthase II